MLLEPGEPLPSQKSRWTHDDVDVMGWHDVMIHATAFDQERREFLLDIDYLFAWVNPKPPDSHYSFWIAACTWVFRDVKSVEGDFKHHYGLTIDEVSRDDRTWTIDGHEGEIILIASGFEQVVRQQPWHVEQQYLRWSQRDGASFDRTPFDAST
ncbi:MAG: hypothetical protein AAF561_09090 [Planctomycetota bacterium]